MRTHLNRWFKLFTLLLLILPLQLLAEGGPKRSEMDNPMVQVFVLIIAILALCIVLMARVLLGAAQYKLKQEQDDKKKADPLPRKAGLLVAGLMIGSYIFAAGEEAVAVKNDTIGGMGSDTFYMLLIVVVVELIILLALLYNLKFLLRQEKVRAQREEILLVKENKWLKYWDKINSLRPLKEEAEIDLGHDYDGIRELDNRLPPWWLYGFFACILFAVIYLWRFEVVHTGPSSLDEYNMAMQKGQDEKEEYLKTAASKVDENSVKLLTDESNLSSGKAIFTTVCAACHSADGGGLVGPNLTDKYWLHGGSIKDVFKTIKYGWQEKGMKSWKDDYTPVQIAQLASYVKSLSGKIPAKAKEPQGVLFEETMNSSDSSKQKTDTTHRVISSVNKSASGL